MLGCPTDLEVEKTAPSNVKEGTTTPNKVVAVSYKKY